MSVGIGKVDRIGQLLVSASDEDLSAEIFADVEAIVRSVIRTRDPHLVLTATHDSLLAVLRYRTGFRGDSRGSTWLYTLARREALRAVARQNNYDLLGVIYCDDDSVPQSPELVTWTDPDAALIGMEVLEECVANKDWRRIWLLYNDPDLRRTHEEVADLVGRTSGTIAVTLSRVRTLLSRI